MKEKKLLGSKEYKLDQFYPELDGLTPPMYAAKHGLVEWLTTHLDRLDQASKKTVLELQNRGGLTPLHFAAQYGQCGAIEILLNHNAPTTIKTKLGALPIHMAFSESIRDAAQLQSTFDLLSANKESLQVTTDDGQSLAHFAAQKDFVSGLACLYLLNKELLDKENNMGISPLITALSSNKRNATVYLLEHVNMNKKDKDGRTPLHNAALSNTEILKLVLEKFSFALEFSDCKGLTPLQMAINNQLLENINILLEANASVNNESPCLQYPIHTAVLTLNIPIVEAIKTKGGMINQKNSHEITPLGMLFAHNPPVKNIKFIRMVLHLKNQGAYVDPNSQQIINSLDLPQELEFLKSPSNGLSH